MSKQLVKERVIKYLMEDLLVPHDMIDTDVPLSEFEEGAEGIIDIIVSVKDKEDYLLTFALIATVLGVIVLCCSDVITGIFRVALGIWIIASGIRNFQTSLVWKEVKSGFWTITVLCALFMIMAGIVILVSRTLAIRIVGIAIVIYAVLDIIARSIFMKKIQNYLDE